MITVCENTIVTKHDYSGTGLYDKTESQIRFLCNYRKYESKDFNWSLSDAEVIIINELLKSSRLCFVISNGQPQVPGFKKFDKEFSELFEEVSRYQCINNKSKLDKLADTLFGNEGGNIYSGVINPINNPINPKAFGFSPFWTFVFTDSTASKLDMSNDILIDDKKLLANNNVTAVLHVDRQNLKIGLCVKNCKEDDAVFSVVSEIFFLSTGSIENIFEASIFWDLNQEI